MPRKSERQLSCAVWLNEPVASGDPCARVGRTETLRMTQAVILPVPTTSGEVTWHTMAGDKQSHGKGYLGHRCFGGGQAAAGRDQVGRRPVAPAVGTLSNITLSHCPLSKEYKLLFFRCLASWKGVFCNEWPSNKTNPTFTPRWGCYSMPTSQWAVRLAQGTLVGVRSPSSGKQRRYDR